MKRYMESRNQSKKDNPEESDDYGFDDIDLDDLGYDF
jgi:hypothetical protein